MVCEENRFVTFCFFLQLPEKIYTSLDYISWKMRFTVPFPMFAYPVYLVSLARYRVFMVHSEGINEQYFLCHFIMTDIYGILSL